MTRPSPVPSLAVQTGAVQPLAAGVCRCQRDELSSWACLTHSYTTVKVFDLHPEGRYQPLHHGGGGEGI